jgi:putative phosphoesterase
LNKNPVNPAILSDILHRFRFSGNQFTFELKNLQVSSLAGSSLFTMKIGLLSDTHGFLDEQLFSFFSDCEEIWHAGDIGNVEVAEKLSGFKPLRAVFGNIDGRELRAFYSEHLFFEVEQLKVFITHIGGYPSKYAPKIKKQLLELKPHIFICGHSHILRIMRDSELNLLHINPGAAGREGFHTVRTAVRFDLQSGQISQMQVIELGKRGTQKI